MLHLVVMGTAPFEARDFVSSDLDSVINVLGLSPQDPLDTFVGE